MEVSSYKYFIIVGLILIIFNRAVGLFLAALLDFNSRVYDNVWENRPVKSAKYDPKKNYGKMVIMLGVFLVFSGILIYVTDLILRKFYS